MIEEVLTITTIIEEIEILMDTTTIHTEEVDLGTEMIEDRDRIGEITELTDAEHHQIGIEMEMESMIELSTAIVVTEDRPITIEMEMESMIEDNTIDREKWSELPDIMTTITEGGITMLLQSLLEELRLTTIHITMTQIE